MLEIERSNHLRCASLIPDWQKMNKNDLINLYLEKENDESLRDAYFSAIMLRYWGNIGKFYIQSKSSGFTIEDCYSWLVEAIRIGLKYRRWKDPDNPLSKDPNAPDKVINRCLFSIRRYHYYLSNRDKRKINHTTLSLDQYITDEHPEDHNTLLKSNEDFYASTKEDLDSYFLIKHYFDCHKYLEGFTLNLLCTSSCIYKSKVNFSRLASSVLLYNENDIETLSVKYNIVNLKDKDSLKQTVLSLSNLSNGKRINVMKKTFQNLSEDETLRRHLCC